MSMGAGVAAVAAGLGSQLRPEQLQLRWDCVCHLRDREEIRLKGYIPTPWSGVTIATGIDLGQQSLIGLRDLGVPTSIINKLRPYLGLSTRAEVTVADLNPNNLVLSQNEACHLDRPFVDAAENVVRSYATRMSTHGLATLVSLRHWAGSLGSTRYTGKLAVHAGGKVRNFVWEAISGRTATDASLATALRNTLRYQRSGTAAYNRIQHEISYLD